MNPTHSSIAAQSFHLDQSKLQIRVIVVEVLSPSTGHIDATAKLADYFKVASVAHYLIIDPEKTLIVHHARGTGDAILARVVTAGSVTLDPPGIEIAVKDTYGA